MVYNLDVSDLIEKHEASGKEITMVYKKVKKLMNILTIVLQ